MPSCEGITRRYGIDRLDLGPLRCHAAGTLEHALVKRCRQVNIEVEEPRSRLRADFEQIREPAIHNQERARAFALKERVGCNRRSHFNDINGSGRNALAQLEAEDAFDSGDRGVRVTFRMLAQELERLHRAVRGYRHDVGKRAAAVDPELPAHLPSPTHRQGIDKLNLHGAGSHHTGATAGRDRDASGSARRDGNVTAPQCSFYPASPSSLSVLPYG
jgi:hypothetical protein